MMLSLKKSNTPTKRKGIRRNKFLSVALFSLLSRSCGTSSYTPYNDPCGCDTHGLIKDYTAAIQETRSLEAKNGKVFEQQVMFQAALLGQLASGVDKTLTGLVDSGNKAAIAAHIKQLGFANYAYYLEHGNLTITSYPEGHAQDQAQKTLICEQDYKDLLEQRKKNSAQSRENTRKAQGISHEKSFVSALLCKYEAGCLNDEERTILLDIIESYRPTLNPFGHWSMHEFVSTLLPIAKTYEFNNDQEDSIEKRLIKYMLRFLHELIEKDAFTDILESEYDKIIKNNPSLDVIGFTDMIYIISKYNRDNETVRDSNEIKNMFYIIGYIFSTDTWYEYSVEGKKHKEKAGEDEEHDQYDDYDSEQEREDKKIIQVERALENSSNDLTVTFSQDISWGTFIQKIEGYSLCGRQVKVNFAGTIQQGYLSNQQFTDPSESSGRIVGSSKDPLDDVNAGIAEVLADFKTSYPQLLQTGFTLIISIVGSDNETIATQKYNLQP